MSSLYETPAERSRRLASTTQTGNWFQDTFTDAVSGGITLGEDGRVKREGLAWWMQGLTPGAQSIAEQKEGLDNSRIIQRQVQDSGLTESQIREQLGDGKLTVGNVSGTIAEAQRTRAEKPTPLQQSQITRGIKADTRLATGQEQANTIAQNSLDLQRETSNNQIEMARIDNRFDRETASADRNLTLRLAQMDREIADKRMDYDRETRRLDKRSEAIAQLMSGLGQLGGAFSL